jgi:hypothetical protein
MTGPEFKQLVMDFKEVFGGPHGERVLARLSDIGFENKVTFVDNDPTGTAFNEGKRFMLLHIRRMMAADPNQEEEKHG